MPLAIPGYRLPVETKTVSDIVSKVGGIPCNVNFDDLCSKNNMQYPRDEGYGMKKVCVIQM